MDDPKGGVFTTEGYALRDEAVFSAARKAGTPVAWNLAGGYQSPVEKVIASHALTSPPPLPANCKHLDAACSSTKRRLCTPLHS